MKNYFFISFATTVIAEMDSEDGLLIKTHITK